MDYISECSQNLKKSEQSSHATLQEEEAMINNIQAVQHLSKSDQQGENQMDTEIEQATQQKGVNKSERDFEEMLRADHNEQACEFQPSYYWPNEDQQLPGSELIVEIVGASAYTDTSCPRIYFRLFLPQLNKNALKVCHLYPQCLPLLWMEMGRLGVNVDDVRKLGLVIRELRHMPIKARLYTDERTGFENLEFMGRINVNIPSETDSAEQGVQIYSDAEYLEF